MILYTSMNRATAQCPFIPESVTFVYFIKMSTYFHTFSPGSPTIQAFSYKTYCLTEYTWRRLQASWRTETTCWWSQPVPPGAPAPTLCGHLLWHFAIQQQSTAPQSVHALLTQVRSMCSWTLPCISSLVTWAVFARGRDAAVPAEGDGDLQTLLCVQACGGARLMCHIVESCPLTKLNGGLSRLHSADEDAVSWLTS